LGLVIAGLAVVVAGLLAMPGSTSDVNNDAVQTVYPLMLLPAIFVVGAGGVAAARRPVTAAVAAAASAINGLQVAGIAVVASRDWLNFAGAGGASFQRGTTGSRLAVTMTVAACGVVLAGGALCGYAADRNRAVKPHVGALLAGVATAVGLPVVLSTVLDRAGLPAVGQFALWWSLPWGAGLALAGTLPTSAARRAALLSVAVSVAFTLVCAALCPLRGFGMRLPDH
jgi:hypothetical protein